MEQSWMLTYLSFYYLLASFFIFMTSCAGAYGVGGRDFVRNLWPSLIGVIWVEKVLWKRVFIPKIEEMFFLEIFVLFEGRIFVKDLL